MNLIDANLVYYGTGLNQVPEYPKGKVAQGLSKLPDLKISDISIIELIVHHRRLSEARRIHKFLSALPIAFVATSVVGGQILSNFLSIDRVKCSQYRTFRKQVTSHKIQLESQLILYCFESIVAAFSHILEQDVLLNTPKKKAYSFYRLNH